MTITYQGQGKFTVKSKDATLELGPEIKVAGRVLPGAGEYEISNVEIEGLDGGIFLFRTEEVFLLYLDRLDRTLTNDELDAVNMADVLFLPVGGNATDVPDLTVLAPEQAVKVINQVDPRIVIPMYFASIEPFRAAEGKPMEMLKDFKVTKSSLPVDERQVVVLM
jgi:L-ascorbate metabolism protein UlaG (beta-lactamase superfamily)